MAGSKTVGVYSGEPDRRPWVQLPLHSNCIHWNYHHARSRIPSKSIFHRRKWKQSSPASRGSKARGREGKCLPLHTSWIRRKQGRRRREWRLKNQTILKPKKHSKRRTNQFPFFFFYNRCFACSSESNSS